MEIMDKRFVCASGRFATGRIRPARGGTISFNVVRLKPENARWASRAKSAVAPYGGFPNTGEGTKKKEDKGRKNRKEGDELARMIARFVPDRG
jgi:hypothetical protein